MRIFDLSDLAKLGLITPELRTRTPVPVLTTGTGSTGTELLMSQAPRANRKWKRVEIIRKEYRVFQWIRHGFQNKKKGLRGEKKF